MKRIGRYFFRLLSEFAAGQKIPDINSGMRVFRRRDMLPFFPLICSGFSFTTTTTLVYLLNDLCVHHVPIDYQCRQGHSKVNHFRDTLRALQIIVEAILRYNPIKIFLLLALPFVLLGTAFVLGALAGRQLECGTVCACVLWAAAGIVLGQGFLAVSVMPQRRCRERDHRELTRRTMSDDDRYERLPSDTQMTHDGRTGNARHVWHCGDLSLR